MDRKAISSRPTEKAASSTPTYSKTSKPSKPSKTTKDSDAQSATSSKAFLSCELCRSRKIKCDKAEGGCTNCKRAGVQCVAISRQRLPRGRKGGRKPAEVELKARVAKLENLVRTLESEKGPVENDLKLSLFQQARRRSGASPSASLAESASEGHTPSDLEVFGRYMSPSFWHSLSTEISGLRDILQEDSEEEDEYGPGRVSSLERNDSNFLFGPGAIATRLEPLQHPPRVMMAALTEIYLRNVDSPIKILHGPMLRGYMRGECSYLNYAPGAPAVEALSFSVYFAAVTSVSEEECSASFGVPRDILCATYRSHVEHALAQAEFVISRDVTILQAFMLYLNSLRCQESGRFTWTLLGMAVRMAFDMNLHQDDIYSRTLFEAEMRRRLWAHIVVADSHSARDRGSAPLITMESFTTLPPRNINDVDLSFESEEPSEEDEGITDTSLLLIQYSGCSTLNQLAFVSNPSPRQPSIETDIDWNKRLQLAHSFRQQLHERFLQHCDFDISYHCALRGIGEVIARNLLVYVFRPLERHPRSIAPPVNGEQLLNITCAAMESFEAALSNPVCARFRWFGVTSNQWHTLAVMVAELCVCPLGQAADRAWAMLEPMILRSRANIAEGPSGMLWRPLEKMVKRAREVRKNALALNSNTAGQEPGGEAWPGPSGGLETNPASVDLANLRVSTTGNVPSPRGYNPGLQRGDQAPMDWASWSWPATYPSVMGSSDVGESPGTGFATWENFLGGIQRAETPVPGMPFYSGPTQIRRGSN